ncbi:hypothetical protein PILCRDRAFT_189544 [Piloderma croceum F 1598]|uniref:Uncharacterized protein n=1 Tax=Piloderma croceum (strain F 1598) TaxID=765440 RepID=A0A0C3CLT3_PILCF|nr:hypothetical protein PILCRDRAFT_189544 [Piloderma croceum F 1598]
MSLPLAHRLPSELLGEIFVFSVPNISVWQFDNSAYREAVMLPGNICRKWREVALATPRMWTSISLNVADGYEEAELAMVSAWLERSAGCLLRLRLVRKSLTPVPAIIDAIIAHSHRCEHLNFVMPFAMIYCLAPAKHRFPQLQSLEIGCPPDEDLPWTMPLEAFEVAPQLRCLVIGNNVSPFFLRVPWSQLEYVHNTTCTVRSDECLEILRLSSNAENIQLELEDLAVPWHVWPVIQSQLEELMLATRTDIGWLLDHITLPSLRTFIYSEEYSCWSISADDLIGILELTPALMWLTLQGGTVVGLTSAVLGRLSRKVSEGGEAICLVPKLHTIVVDWYGLDEQAFVDMIESRWRVSHQAETSPDGNMSGVSQIQSVILEVGDAGHEIDPTAFGRLRQFASEGLDVEWQNVYASIELVDNSEGEEEED